MSYSNELPTFCPIFNNASTNRCLFHAHTNMASFDKSILILLSPNSKLLQLLSLLLLIKYSPYIVKSFFLIFQGIFSSISQMNEPRRWTFLCIWYENRGVGVHKIKRHHFRSTWPCVYPPIYGSEPPVSTRITRISAGS